MFMHESGISGKNGVYIVYGHYDQCYFLPECVCECVCVCVCERSTCM